MSECVEIGGELLMIGELGRAIGPLSIEKVKHRCTSLVKREVFDIERILGRAEISVFVQAEPIACRDELGVGRLPEQEKRTRR